MKVLKLVERDDEHNEVNLELSDEQLRFVTEVGIGALLATGAATIAANTGADGETGDVTLTIHSDSVTH